VVETTIQGLSIKASQLLFFFCFSARVDEAKLLPCENVLQWRARSLSVDRCPGWGKCEYSQVHLRGTVQTARRYTPLLGGLIGQL
jgi:hypothetical protein